MSHDITDLNKKYVPPRVVQRFSHKTTKWYAIVQKPGMKNEG